MILVTGGTGFIGSALIRQLAYQGHSVRILLRPSKISPQIPHGVPVEVAVAALNDQRGIRAAMKNVDVVFHLIGTERHGSQANLNEVEVEGTQAITTVARQAGVQRIFFMSHLGADQFSGYPLLKAKGLAERIIEESQVPFTIFRSGPIFGPGDQFTTQILTLIRRTPFFFFNPGGGKTLFQPLWIEDLTTTLTWALDESFTVNKRYEIGGLEQLTYLKIVKTIMTATKKHRLIIPAPPTVLRSLALFAEQSLGGFPISIFWLDQLSVNRICALDTLPKLLGLLPARFSQHLDYLRS
ncbi:MAG TPA: NAD(P)H-binding protein [Longilinea sp.]|nr:NAD(P)H-binding protein [Longilinea sp.]